MKRQNIRKLLLLISMLLFPITLYYLSPVLILNAAFRNIMNGSFITFCCMFLLSIPFGRLFCGYICPAGGIQECAYAVNDKVCSNKFDKLKYIIWALWLTAVIVCYIINGGIKTADPLFMTANGISVTDIQSYIIYYGIICLILIPCLIGGKRAFCRRFCWMSPFMAAGSRLRRIAHLPGLHISAESGCAGCGKFSKICPMGIDVKTAAEKGSIDSAECILCGSCIDSCPKNILKYEMGYHNDRKKA